MPSANKRTYDAMQSSESESPRSSPPHKAQRFATSELTTEEHAKIDQTLLAAKSLAALRNKGWDPNYASTLLSAIVNASPNLDQAYVNNETAASLIDEHDDLLPILKNAWDQKKFASIRRLSFLQNEQPHSQSSYGYHEKSLNVPNAESIAAASNSWHTPYTGGAEVAFIDTIKKYSNKYNLYANCISVVQSSGKSKSRMIHEAGVHVFSIIMNIRQAEADGFPFSDSGLRMHLLQVKTQHGAYLCYYKFLVALFDEIAQVLVDPQTMAQSPEGFRKYMGYGQASGRHAEEFFEKVICAANAMKEVQTPTGSSVRSPLIRIKKRSDDAEIDDTLDAAAKKLTGVIDGLSPSVDDSQHHVKFILCLDEAHEMAMAGEGQDWSPFSEFRRVLRSIRYWPLFGVFLSTSGSIGQFQPAEVIDNSNPSRLQVGVLRFLPPFSQVGFDQLASPVRPGDNFTLDNVTKPEFMVRLGRPFFGTRFEYGSSSVRQYIVDFARQKLLNGYFGRSSLSRSQSLALLAVRLPLDFDPLAAAARAEEELHVEQHMRICLGARPGAGIMMTVSPSGPVLAEAAAGVMQEEGVNCARILNDHLKRAYLSKGKRGEAVTMLLLLLAHDNAIKPESKQIMPYHQPVPVLEFLSKLFTQQHHDAVYSCPVTQEAGDTTVKELFNDSWLHFTHFVRVVDVKVLNRKFLWCMMVRGAAVLYVNDRAGVDVIVPFCYRGKRLCEENTSAILVQNKNDVTHNTHRLLLALFTAMNPTLLGIFKPTLDVESLPPVIKIVLSLESDSASTTTTVPAIPTRFSIRTSRTPSLSVDIFASGVSHETFGPVKEVDEKIWQALVLQTKLDVYGDSTIARVMNPCASSETSHWEKFAPLS